MFVPTATVNSAQIGKADQLAKRLPRPGRLVGATQSIARTVTDPGDVPNGMALALARTCRQPMDCGDPDIVFMGPAAIQHSSLLVGLIAVLAAAALAFLIARSLTRPIARLTAAVEGVAQKGTAIIPVDAGGETGVLARARLRG